MSDIAILIAHKREVPNDASLKVCLDTFIDNTDCDYELFIDTTTPADPYQVYNKLANQASAEWLLFVNSDTYAGPNWARPMLEAASVRRIVSPVLVECGAIGVHPQNHHLNFGMTPESFQRERFEAWCRSGGAWRDGEGWYMPSLHNRRAFQAMGGFDTSRGVFPTTQIDVLYWQAWKETGGEVVRVPVFFYHLQNWSNEREQQKEVRYGV